MSAVPENLRRFFEDNPKPALAFSGGADSSYLLYAAVECVSDVTAYFVKTQFQPMFELEDAKKTAEHLGVELHIILQNALSDPEVRANPANRCYLCKKNIFSSIIAKAREDKKKCVIDASNASDDPAERPGMKALEELGVLSPLRMCGITKPMVRELSREADLWTWNLPSNSCLATRIPTGMVLTDENLLRTEETEDELRILGLSDFRVRTTSEGAVLETVAAQRELLENRRSDVERVLMNHFPSVSYKERVPKA